MHENLDIEAKDYPENFEDYHREDNFYVGQRLIISYLSGVVWDSLHEYVVQELSEKHIKLSGTWYSMHKKVIIEERLKPKEEES